MVKIEDLHQLLAEVNAKGALRPNISEDEDLFKLGALDSMAVVQFILAIEKKYSIKIAKKDISFNTFSNLKNVRALISSKIA